MWDVVRSLVADGATVLLTTQYLEEADALADEIIVIDHGRVIAHDTPDGLKRIVGGQTLTRAPGRPGAASRTVARSSASVAGARPDDPAARHRQRRRSPATRRCAEAVAASTRPGIAVTELSLHLPSLDEVFFALTGAARRAATPSYEEVAA